MPASFSASTTFKAIDKFSAPISRMQRATTQFTSKINGVSKALNPLSRFSSLGGFIGITSGIGAATTLLGKFVKEAAKIENAEASFTPILGSVKNAKKLVEDLNKTAATTPFQFENLASSANLLLGFGAATQKDVIPIMRMLGDTAQGSADKLSGISLAYGQTIAAGKANMIDINQLINNSVPILGELADMWGGISIGAAREAVTKGRATSAEITKAFERMTSKGGKFFNGMAIASKTFTGRMSTLRDNINLTFADLGNHAMPILKEYVTKVTNTAKSIREWATENKKLIKDNVTEWLGKIATALKFLKNNFFTIIKVIKWYIALLVFLKVASIAAATWTYSLAIATGLYKAAIWLVNAAIWVYNAALGANTFAQGASSLALAGNTAAVYGYIAASYISTGTTWLATTAATAFAAAVNLGIWPLTLIALAIVAVVTIMVVAIKKWDEWGSILILTLGPLGTLVSLVMSFIRHWDSITKAFAEGGVLGGIKRIGAVLIDVVLYPLQKILELVNKIPGVNIQGGVDFVTKLRSEMDLSDSGSVSPVINNAQTRDENKISREEKSEKSILELIINSSGSDTTLNKYGANLSSVDIKSVM